MRIVQTLLILVFFKGAVLAHNIIFVHLGETILPCLFTTMKQARYLNQDDSIFLLTDERAHTLFESKYVDLLLQDRIILVNMKEIPFSKEHVIFQEINKIDFSIADGFWVYALERFFTLYDFIQEKKLENIIHLESDSMLYVGLDELIPLFTRLNLRLSAPFQSLYGCIPCFVFIKDRDSLSFLIEHILHEIKGYSGAKPHVDLNDMQLLASLYRKLGSSYMMPLPTLMPEYIKYYPKRRSHFAPDNATHLSFLSSNSFLFPEYIFDAAGLGIFINGNDRRYSPNHGPGTIHARSLFNPSFFSFYWGEDKKGRNVPYLSFKGESYRIVNMHFHSKMVENHTSFGETREEFDQIKKRKLKKAPH